MGNNVYVGTRTSDCYGKLFMIESNKKVSEIKDWIETYGEVRSLAVIDNDLYVGSRVQVVDNKFSKDGLYKSSDGGIIFTEVFGWNKDYSAVVSLLPADNNLYIGSKNYNDKTNQNYQGKLFFKKIK